MQCPERGMPPGDEFHVPVTEEREHPHPRVCVRDAPEPPPAQHPARSPRRVNPHAGVAANYKPAAIVATRTRPCRTVVVPAPPLGNSLLISTPPTRVTHRMRGRCCYHRQACRGQYRQQNEPDPEHGEETFRLKELLADPLRERVTRGPVLRDR